MLLRRHIAILSMKIKRSTAIPIALAIYLGVMAYIGYPGYASGATSAFTYFGTIAITIVILIVLHFNLRYRERLRRRREEDINKTAGTK